MLKVCKSRVTFFVFHFQKMRSLRPWNIIILAMVVLSISAHAQWAQTFGWGGAGNGKRAVDALPSSCNTDNTKFMSIISTLIQVRSVHCP